MPSSFRDEKFLIKGPDEGAWTAEEWHGADLAAKHCAPADWNWVWLEYGGGMDDCNLVALLSPEASF
jgi:hypothetical protein